MHKKKNIIFYLNKQTQYLGSFHENSKIKYIKAYFRDISNISEFNLIYNNEVILDEEISLKNLSATKTDIIFNVQDIREMQMEETKSNEKNKIIKLEKHNKEIESNMETFKGEISN